MSGNSRTPTTTPAAGGNQSLASRRTLLGAAALPVALAVPPAKADDPVLALYQRRKAIEAAQAVIDRQVHALRAELVERWGKRQRDVSFAEQCGQDPAFPEFNRLCNESDRLNGESTALIDCMMKMPATSAAGVLVKLRLALEVWPSGRSDEELEYHEAVALACMRDAVRLLEGAEVLS
ncbi:MAG: hypothetical protein ACLGP3_03385 [Acidobacteriota bacterium]